ncbi:uncharacterized protein LOC107265922 [Cephus cinctus]|uniref:Uncharacterized protein LOC107265922 n=1 Tax=Cephus cinctus TaxID=211228 RepID=A0AAJ7FGZ0_CEPCN|nr:uncharacterized protein LOC107265922 [Cephus cinctus]
MLFPNILFLGLLCSFSRGHVSILPIPKDFVGHGTQYRFQYFVRDELGDYKTQEEAGDGDSVRGSYAVEEPDGDLRIVQYTTDLGRGFKAHIKVDRVGRSASKLQEIDIPASEIKKLIADNRKKVQEEPEKPKSKGYVLGPPKTMSDIIMEQAAAIREIISKEIETEQKEEQLESENTLSEINKKNANPVTDCSHLQIEPSKLFDMEQESQSTLETVQDESTEKFNTEIVEKIVTKNIESTIISTEENKSSKNKNTTSSDFNFENVEENTMSQDSEFTSTFLPELTETGSPQTKDLMTAKSVDFSSMLYVHDAEEREKSNLQSLTSQQQSGREILLMTPSPALAGPLLGGPARNVNSRNRIMLYKPAERKLNHIINPSFSQDIVRGPKNQKELSILRVMNLNKNYHGKNHEERSLRSDKDEDRIVLYSPLQQSDQQSHRKARYFSVPYSVIRPYIMTMDEETS